MGQISALRHQISLLSCCAMQTPVKLPHQLAESLLEQLKSKGRQPAPLSLLSQALLLPDYTSLPQPSSVAQPGQQGDSSHSEIGPSSANGCCLEEAESSSRQNCSQAICVEIKPKCGFLPTAATIHPSNAVKRRVSRFQLHQALKAAQVIISTT